MVSATILITLLSALGVSAAPTVKRGGPVSLPLTRASVPQRQNRHAGSGSAGLITWGRDSRYTTRVSIGTPPQEVEVIIDTGSTTLWVADNGDAQPGSTEAAEHYFNHSHSSTFKYTLDSAGAKEPFSIGYLKGFTKGYLAEDTVALGPFVQKDQGFMAANKWADGALQANHSGIIGLGWPLETDPEPFWHRLAQQWDDKRFGLYLERAPASVTGNDDASPGGVLTLGGVDDSLFTGEIQYLPLLGGKGIFGTHWSVTADGIYANGNSLFGNSRITAVTDSGSSVIVASKAHVAKLFQNVPGAAFDDSASRANGIDIYRYPCDAKFELEIAFGGVHYAIQSGDLVLAKTNDGQCLAAVTGADINFWLLGDPFLKNVYTVHRVDPPAVGFAKPK